MITIKIKKYVNAIIEAPPSKSYTQRALIVASLANGKSIIKNPLFSEDTMLMISALKKFGAEIKIKDKDFIVYGTNGNLNPAKKIFVGNAGTTMRFITSLAALSKGITIITGNARMQQRPIKDLLEALRQLGITSESNEGFPPVKIYGGSLNGGNAKLRGNVSSQYLSSLLMCASYAKNSTTINIVGNLTSKPYVDITIDVMKKFRVKVKNINYKKFIIKHNQKYKAINYKIEGDASNASYFFAAAAVAKGKIMVNNINPNSKQGDIKFVDLLRKMGCSIKNGKDSVQVEGRSLKSIDVDMNETPDIVPTLAVTSLFADSVTKIRNVSNLRFKESDRLKALANELRKIGADVKELDDGLEIKRKRLRKAIIETYNDHRMAMSFAIAGLAINGINIKNPGCVAKSFPGFWKKFNELYKK